MQSFRIAGFPPGNAAGLFQSANRPFCSRAQLVRLLLFRCSSGYARPGTQIFFQVHVEHAPAGRRCTGVLAGGPPFTFSLDGAPLHFGANQFQGGDFTAEMGFAAFPLHGKGRILWTAGNAVFLERAIGIRQGKCGTKRDQSLFKVEFLKKGLVEFDGIKGRIS